MSEMFEQATVMEEKTTDTHLETVLISVLLRWTSHGTGKHPKFVVMMISGL